MITLYVNSKIGNDANAISLDDRPVSIGARIEERLEVVGISQSELARRVGVRQSTMNSLIRGDNRTSRSILKIARELRTTPAYLTGEIDDPDPADTQSRHLDMEERELVDNFVQLTPADRRALLQIVRSMAGAVLPAPTADARHFNAKSHTLHTPKSSFRGEGE